MTKHFDAARGQRLPEHALDALFEFISTYVSPNFSIGIVNATTIQVVAGTVNDQVAAAVMGRIRYRTTNVQAAMPGSPGAGSYDVYLTGSDNSYSNTPDPDTDNTVYDFGLEIRTAGVPSTAIYRKVAQVVWSGSAITAVNMLVGAAGQLAANSVGTIQLQDGSVTNAKLANLAVTAGKIATDTITATQIAPDAVGASEIAAGAVGTSELATDAVDASKIAASAVGASEIADLSVGTAELAAGAVNSTKLAGGLALTGATTIDSDLTARSGAAGATLIGNAGPGGEAGVKLGSAGDTSLYRHAADVLRTDDTLLLTRTNVGDDALQVRRGADTNTRLIVHADGSLAWGSGSATPDANLSRQGVNELLLDSNFRLRSSATLADNSSVNSRVIRYIARYDANVAVGPITDTDYAVTAGISMLAVGASPKATWRLQDNSSATFFQVDDDGVVWVGGAGARDTNLYRSGANVLRTDDDLAVGASVTTAGGSPVGGYLTSAGLLALSRTPVTASVVTATTPGESTPRFSVLANGQLEWGGGAGARDIFLYRGTNTATGLASPHLKTDGQFEADGIFTNATWNRFGTAGFPFKALKHVVATRDQASLGGHVGTGNLNFSLPAGSADPGDLIVFLGTDPRTNPQLIVNVNGVCQTTDAVAGSLFNADSAPIDPVSTDFHFLVLDVT
jgi:hypothetical protein